MTKRTEELLDTSAAVLICAGVFGAGIWRAARRQPAAANPAEPEAQRHEEPALQNLSLSTPGDAPLDRVARLAVQKSEADLLIAGEQSSAGDLLEHQALGSAPLEGWSSPEPDRLPLPTYAPAVMAFGIVLFAMGLATVWYVCLAGSVVFAIAAWRWTGELQGE